MNTTHPTPSTPSDHDIVDLVLAAWAAEEQRAQEDDFCELCRGVGDDARGGPCTLCKGRGLRF